MASERLSRIWRSSSRSRSACSLRTRSAPNSSRTLPRSSTNGLNNSCISSVACGSALGLRCEGVCCEPFGRELLSKLLRAIIHVLPCSVTTFSASYTPALARLRTVLGCTPSRAAAWAIVTLSISPLRLLAAVRSSPMWGYLTPPDRLRAPQRGSQRHRAGCNTLRGSLTLRSRFKLSKGRKGSPNFTLQSARNGGFMDAGGLYECPPGRKEGVIPGAHVAHPYRLYRGL